MHAGVGSAARRSAARQARRHSPRARDAMDTVSYGKSQGWIGASVRRKEDGRLLTGQGRYVDDLHEPDTLHIALLRSPHGHARIRRVDLSAARALPGVIAVVDGATVMERLGPVPTGG